MESAPTARERPLTLNVNIPPDHELPGAAPELRDLLRRITVIEHNQRDALFLLRSMWLALHNVRVELSPETRRIHREVVRLPPFDGLCPCCLQTKIVSEKGGIIPPAEFDHFLGPVYSAPVHSWLICRPCHLDLNNDGHLAWYAKLTTRFRRYQAAAQAYTAAFSRRTPAKLYTARLAR